jgi:hypothetical protein
VNYDDFLKSMMGGAGGMYGGLDPNKMSAGEMQRQLELRLAGQAQAQDALRVQQQAQQAGRCRHGWYAPSCLECRMAQAAGDLRGAARRAQGLTPEPPVEYPGPLEGFPPAPRGFFWVELIPPVGMVVAFVLAVLMVL